MFFGVLIKAATTNGSDLVGAICGLISVSGSYKAQHNFGSLDGPAVVSPSHSWLLLPAGDGDPIPAVAMDSPLDSWDCSNRFQPRQTFFRPGANKDNISP